MKNYLWLETKSFLGSKNFFMRDCFQQRSNDSKPVEDFLRVVWTPLPTAIWMELKMGVMDGDVGDMGNMGLGDMDWVTDMDVGSVGAYG